jgi:hypothetical protein
MLHLGLQKKDERTIHDLRREQNPNINLRFLNRHPQGSIVRALEFVRVCKNQDCTMRFKGKDICKEHPTLCPYCDIEAHGKSCSQLSQQDHSSFVGSGLVHTPIND